MQQKRCCSSQKVKPLIDDPLNEFSSFPFSFIISGYEQTLEEALNGAIFDEDHDESEFQFFLFFFVAKVVQVQTFTFISTSSGRREGHWNVQYVWASPGPLLRQSVHRLFALQEDFGIKQTGSVTISGFQIASPLVDLNVSLFIRLRIVEIYSRRLQVQERWVICILMFV